MNVGGRHKIIILEIGIVKVGNIPLYDNVAVHIQDAIHRFGQVTRGENTVIDLLRPPFFGRRPREHIVAEGDGAESDAARKIPAVFLEIGLGHFLRGDIHRMFAGIIVRKGTDHGRKIRQIFFIYGCQYIHKLRRFPP